MVGTALKIITALLPVKDSDKLYDLTEHKEKRTLSQNALYFKFIGLIADSLRLPKPTVHNMMLREFSYTIVYERIRNLPIMIMIMIMIMKMRMIVIMILKPLADSKLSSRKRTLHSFRSMTALHGVLPFPFSMSSSLRIPA